MRRLVYPVVALSLLATNAVAQRPSTLNMTCAEATALVAQAGSIVLSTGQYTYDRYVAAPGYCFIGEYAWRSHAPTIDVRQCRLGYTCRPGTHPLFDDF
jgi:hypothetical protein